MLPLVSTDSVGSWNERETTDFVNEVLEFSPEKGDEKWNGQPIVLAMGRHIGGKEQKIMVLGNADCLSNGELVRSRKDVKSANFSLILETVSYTHLDVYKRQDIATITRNKTQDSPYGTFSEYAKANPYSPAYDEKGKPMEHYARGTYLEKSPLYRCV